MNIYGLIGIFTTLQIVVKLLGGGAGLALNRALSQSSIEQEIYYKALMNDTVKTFEYLFYFLTLIIFILLGTSSYFFAKNWINVETSLKDKVGFYFLLMTINFSLQFLGSLYENGLQGLQKQVLSNILIIIFLSLQALSGILALWLITPSLECFLFTQITINSIQVTIFRWFLWKNIPKYTESSKFNLEILKRYGRFAVGLTSTSILIVLLTQSDKIILSKIINTESFGYYTLAGNIASSLSIFAVPIANAIFPKASQLFSLNNHKDISYLFHRSCILMSILILPIGLNIIAFAHPIIELWMQNNAIATKVTPILQLLIVGTIFNALMTIPYQFSLAKGWTRFGFNISLCALLLFIPTLFFAITKYGILGSAASWTVLNSLYLIFAMQYLFTNMLQTEKRRWYSNDVGKPIFLSLISVYIFYYFSTKLGLTKIDNLILCFISIIVSYFILIYFSPFRDVFKNALKWIIINKKQ